jgi:hypothetical protein
MVVDPGALCVSAQGMYLDTAGGLYPWSWPELSRAELAGPGALAFSGNSVHGPISWQLVSEFAELAFLCWAVACHPRHPQLVNGTWVRAGWRPPPSLPAIES